MSEEIKNSKNGTSIIKPFLAIDIEKGGRKYTFSMEVGSPIGEAYDAAYAVLAELLEMSKKAAANAKPKELAADKKEKAKEEAK